MITVAGIFDSREGAERAAARLRSVGVAEEHLALLSPGTPDREVEEKVLTVETEEPHAGEKVGGAVGRGIGIAGGIMVGGAVGSFFVPGAGTVLAAGALGAVLLGTGGAAIGKATGHALDEAVVRARLHDELHVFEEALRAGRTVVVAMGKDEEEAGAARAELSGAGALSLEEAREIWWGGLRAAEGEEYAKRGQDFTTEEELFRRGFEAALHPHRRGKTFAEAADYLRERYGEDYREEAFRRGYERGQAHHRGLIGAPSDKEEPRS
jgi:hypothetical protein